MAYKNKDSNFISPEFCQALHQSALEILGENDLQKLIKKAGLSDCEESENKSKGLPTAHISHFLNAMTGLYALPSAQGLCQRMGRVTFAYIRRYFPEVGGLGVIEHRLQPLDRRIQSFLNDLAFWLEKHLNCQIHIERTEKSWQWVIKEYPLIHAEKEISGGCFFLKGFLQDGLEWMESRRSFGVEMACSDKKRCVFTISIKPID